MFGGGPKDKSILTEYADHVACKLWDGLVYQQQQSNIYFFVNWFLFHN